MHSFRKKCFFIGVPRWSLWKSRRASFWSPLFRKLKAAGEFRKLLGLFLAGGLLVLTISSWGNTQEKNTSASSGKTEKHRLGTQLRVLKRDLTSQDYHNVLETMIRTDLAAEWRRVATPDNYLTFLEKHGGKERVLADPALKAAYQKRRRIAEQFLDLMRAEYKKRDRKPPFDAEQVRKLLQSPERETSQGSLKGSSVQVVMPAPGSESQWPRFRGPTGQGEASATDLPLKWSGTENVRWKVSLTGRGNSSPVVWGDRLWVTTASDSGKKRLLLCYSRQDGRLLWKREAPRPSDQEKLYWKNSYASSTPVTDGERVIVFFGNSGLLCYDVNGKLQWHRELGPFVTMHGPGTSPVLYKDRVIFIQDQNRGESVFVAFDKKTGEKLWERERPNNMGWSTPVVLRVGNHDELVYNGSHEVVGYDPLTGDKLWWLEGSSKEAIPTIVVGSGLIYSTSGRNGPTLAMRPGGEGDVTETHLQWRTVRGGPHVPSPVYYEGRLYIVNDTGIVTCLDAENGDTLWQNRLRGRFSMSPIEADGKILMTNEKGLTYILQPSPEFELLAENDLEETTLATPAVLGGRIYFRTESSLICIGKETGTSPKPETSGN